jgi:hypothetical protein
MKTKVVHCMRDKYDIYVGRGKGERGKFGNPYTHKKEPGTLAQYVVNTKEEAIDKYREYILSRPDLLDALEELKGKILGCWCTQKGPIDHTNKPYVCHGQVLCELIAERFGDED